MNDEISLRTRMLVHYLLMYGDYEGAYEVLSKEPAVQRIIERDMGIHYALMYGDYKTATYSILSKISPYSPSIAYAAMYDTPELDKFSPFKDEEKEEEKKKDYRR